MFDNNKHEPVGIRRQKNFFKTIFRYWRRLENVFMTSFTWIFDNNQQEQVHINDKNAYKEF